MRLRIGFALMAFALVARIMFASDVSLCLGEVQNGNSEEIALFNEFFLGRLGGCVFDGYDSPPYPPGNNFFTDVEMGSFFGETRYFHSELESAVNIVGLSNYAANSPLWLRFNETSLADTVSPSDFYPYGGVGVYGIALDFAENFDEDPFIPPTYRITSYAANGSWSIYYLYPETIFWTIDTERIVAVSIENLGIDYLGGAAVYLDGIFFGSEKPLFSDDFESGDLHQWIISGVLPE